MPGQVNVTESQAQPTLPADADFAMCLIGYMSQSPLDAGQVSPPYGSPAALASDYGLGDAVDAATQAITKTPGNPSPPPVCVYATPATTAGVRGTTLDTSGITGTAVVTKKATTPKGTYQPKYRVKDDGNNGNGGLIGTAGIILEASPDDGRTWLEPQALGTAFTIAMEIGGETTGVEYDIAPSTTNAAYVALAVELRADTLAHLANNTAHDGADTNAGQVALAASSVPATVAASTAVVNLALTAWQLHVVNITSVHDGPDLVAHTALAALVAATNAKEGIDLGIALKGIANTHMGVALTASTAGLMGATASVASPQTYTAASHFLAGGVAAMDAQPRKPKITISGSGTPADMADSVTFTGFDYAGNAQTESGLSLTGLGTVIATKAFKGTGLSAAFVAADGTGASYQLGYSNGVHNSADSTNTISAADPTYGTLFTGDIWSESKTTPPMWGVTDLYDASDPDDITGAFAAIAAFGSPFAIVVITEPVAVGNLATITAGLNYVQGTFGKRPACLIRFRDPNADETDAEYITAFRTFRASVHDDRIGIVVGSGWLTDAFRGYVYFRSGQPAVLARMQSMAVIPGQQGERMAQHPGYVARGPLENFSLVDTSERPISQAHDESVRGGIDGPINGAGGGITFYYQRRTGIKGTYVSEAPVMYPALSQILTWMDRRVANGIEGVAELTAWASIQGADILDEDPDTGAKTLDQDGADALQTSIGKAIADRYGKEFQNAEDRNLVQVNREVTLNLSHVTVDGDIEARLYGYTHTVNLRFSATR